MKRKLHAIYSTIRIKLKNEIWILKIRKDQLFKKLGYTPTHIHNNKMLSLRMDLEKKIEEEYNRNLDLLINAIHTVNMVKVRLSDPHSIKWFENGDISQNEKVQYTTEFPYELNWYKYQVMIDVSRLQRIYQELQMSQNSYEFEYLKQSLWRDIERNLDALMKLELGIR